MNSKMYSKIMHFEYSKHMRFFNNELLIITTGADLRLNPMLTHCSTPMSATSASVN